MASVKVKFRPSTIEGKTGALYFQVIHRRIVRSQKTKYKIYPDEWNARTARITPSPSRPDRHSILSRYRHEIKQDLFRLSGMYCQPDAQKGCHTVLTTFSDSIVSEVKMTL